jgi:hypothetical protein
MLSLTLISLTCGSGEYSFPPYKSYVSISGANVVRFEYPITNNQILEDGFEISYDNNTFYSNCQEDYGIIKISSNPSSPYNDIYPYDAIYQTSDGKIQIHFNSLYYKPYGVMSVRVFIRNLTESPISLNFKKYLKTYYNFVINNSFQICYSSNNYRIGLTELYPIGGMNINNNTCSLSYALFLYANSQVILDYGYIIGSSLDELLASKNACASCRAVVSTKEANDKLYEVKGNTIIFKSDKIFKVYDVQGRLIYKGSKSVKLSRGVYFIHYLDKIYKEVIR